MADAKDTAAKADEGKFYTITNNAPGGRTVNGVSGQVLIPAATGPNQPGQGRARLTQAEYENAKGHPDLVLVAERASETKAAEAPKADQVNKPQGEADPTQTQAAVELNGGAGTGQANPDGAGAADANTLTPDRIVNEGFGKFRAYAGDTVVTQKTMTKAEATKYAAENRLEMPASGGRAAS